MLKKLLQSARGTAGTHNKQNRDKWLTNTLSNIPAGGRILDAGAGELQYAPLCSHLDYVSQDFAQYDGQGDGSGFQMGNYDNSRLDIVSDIISIPEPDESFDAIMCVEVLEHVPYPVDALKELTRLLRPDGYLIVTAPFCSLTHFAPYHYQTGFNRYFYEHWLGNFGYDIVEIDYNGNFFEYLAQELRRVPAFNEQFANRGTSLLTKVAMVVLLRDLQRSSMKDQSSERLLSFGLHILARKLRKATKEGHK